MQVVGSARFFKMLHSADEDANGTSFAGSTGEEGPARRVSLEIVDAASGAGAGNGHGGYNSLEVERAANKPRLGLIADNRDRSISMAPDRHLSTASEASDEVGGDDIHVDVRKDMLAALDAARTIAMKRQEAKDLTSLKNKKYFAREVEEQEDEGGSIVVNSCFHTRRHKQAPSSRRQLRVSVGQHLPAPQVSHSQVECLSGLIVALHGVIVSCTVCVLCRC